MSKKFHVLIYILLSLYISVKAEGDWLHVNDKAEIVDSKGNQVWLTGVNWFGFNTGTGFFDGVWNGNFIEKLTGIADHGFNLLRVPMSTEIILQWKNGEPDKSQPCINGYTNPELTNDGVIMSSFELWGKTIEACKKLGIKIMMDIHSASTDGSGHVYNLWYNSKITTDDWLEALEWFASKYKNDDTIIAIDIKNEPHGKGDDTKVGKGAKWDDSTDENNWKYAAERAALKILGVNPNLLIMVEGIEVYPKEGYDWTSPTHDYAKDFDPYYGAWWGGNLRGVKEYPIDLGKYQSQLVYSPHDYGPLVYAQSWFHAGFTSDSIMEEYWHDSWFFILEEKIAPLLIGEWGGFMGGDNQKWMTFLRDLMIDNHIHHTFWCYNENSGDTGGLVQGDAWDMNKYNLVKKALWQSKEGKFISLYHDTPLGSKGISLNDYYS